MAKGALVRRVAFCSAEWRVIQNKTTADSSFPDRFFTAHCMSCYQPRIILLISDFGLLFLINENCNDVVEGGKHNVLPLT